MTIQLERPLAPAAPDAPIGPGPAAGPLSMALVPVAGLTAALTLVLPDVLRGPAVMNGSARGTALVVLLATLPVLVVGLVLGRRGSAFGVLLWAGAVAHVLYQSVLFLFATPFNALYLLDVATFALALWSAVALAGGLDVHAIRARIADPVPVRPIAIYVWVVVALNALAWLAVDVPALFEDGTPSSLVGTGMTTNPIHIQDLAFWLPLMAAGAWALWRERARGYVVVGVMLTMWLLESLTVAVDQWMGSSADPISDVATRGGAAVFAILAVVSVVPWVAFYRRVAR